MRPASENTSNSSRGGTKLLKFARGDFYARYDEFWRRAAARAWYARGARAVFFLKKTYTRAAARRQNSSYRA
jgi:hypothetical protein